MPDCHEEAESVIFVDEDTDSVSAKNDEELVEKLQREVNNSVNWLKVNRLCDKRQERDYHCRHKTIEDESG